ncbi:MAG: DEAD/DEAH box helicase [Bacteroidota bacterium]
MQFKELPLHALIQKAVAEMNYREATPIQVATIPMALAGNDLIASAETGTGKTAAFALPLIQRLLEAKALQKKQKKIRGLIVSPTRELAVQIHDSIQSYAMYTKLNSGVLFGGTSIEPQLARLKKGVDIITATPGRLLDLHKQDQLNLDYVEYFVIDEADLMLDMGFIDDVQKIARLCPEEKQTLLFSATMPTKVVQLARSILRDPERIDVTPTSAVAGNVKQGLYYVSKSDKIELCLHLLRNTIRGNLLIFRRTKNQVAKLEQSLLKNGFLVDSLHGDKSQSERQRALNRFRNGAVQVLIATDVASRGIDIERLDNVLNFDVPGQPETYVHRIGRTGRAGEEGIAHTFCAAEERSNVKAIQKLIRGAIPVIEEHPYPQAKDAQPQVHKKKGSKHKKGRKSAASKKNKKRWY